MSIWLVLWVLLSLALLFFMGWTLTILFAQKKVWKAYAKAHKLRYRAKQTFGVPEISGAMGAYTIDVFSSEHMGEEARGSRKLTAIEIQLSSMLPVEAGVASGGLVDIVEKFSFKEELRPDHKDWGDTSIARSENRDVLDGYLTPERLDALIGLMKVDNAWVILIFRGDMALLRFDTPDPLSSLAKLEALIDQMLKAAAVLELHKGEAGKLKVIKATKRQKEVSLKVDGDAMETGLSLEDDESDVSSEEPLTGDAAGASDAQVDEGE